MLKTRCEIASLWLISETKWRSSARLTLTLRATDLCSTSDCSCCADNSKRQWASSSQGQLIRWTPSTLPSCLHTTVCCAFLRKLHHRKSSTCSSSRMVKVATLPRSTLPSSCSDTFACSHSRREGMRSNICTSFACTLMWRNPLDRSKSDAATTSSVHSCSTLTRPNSKSCSATSAQRCKDTWSHRA